MPTSSHPHRGYFAPNVGHAGDDEQMLSTIDVIEGYLSGKEDHDFSRLSGRDIDAFGERVREFSSSFTPEIDATLHPIYLGGWPSANFLHLGGDMVMSSLLYSGQVLVRDPIADWFAVERYGNEHMLAARRGFHHPEDDAETRTRTTRAFLNSVIPQLMRMRPLIESGLVVPVPTEPVYLQQRQTIERLRRDLRTHITLDPVDYAARFTAHEIASEDNVRGFFVFAPGPDPSPGIREAINHGYRYFAREFTLSDTYGVTYTAPFAHEQFLCRQGISRVAGTSASVVEAVLRSGLPVFHGLTPSVIRDVHDDVAFGEFRAQLHEVYQGTPLDDPTTVDAYVRDQEDALLRPLIQQAERAGSNGFLSRLGASLTANKYGIAAALATDLVAGSFGAATATAVAGTFVDDALRHKKDRGPIRIWSSLISHHRSAKDELQCVLPQPASYKVTTSTPWGIPREPGMSYAVTSGEAIWDMDARSLAVPEIDEDRDARLGVYRQCRCGSGQKYRFCCDGLK